MNKYFLSLLSILVIFSLDLSAQNSEIPLKLRVGTYNVGHFNQGRLGGFQGEGRIVQAELNNWRRWIGQQSLDIIGLNEWNLYFDKDSSFHATDELLKPYYSNIYFGTQNTWIYNRFASNFGIYTIHEEVRAGQYYAVFGGMRIDGKIRRIISSNLPW